MEGNIRKDDAKHDNTLKLSAQKKKKKNVLRTDKSLGKMELYQYAKEQDCTEYIQLHRLFRARNHTGVITRNSYSPSRKPVTMSPWSTWFSPYMKAENKHGTEKTLLNIRTTTDWSDRTYIFKTYVLKYKNDNAYQYGYPVFPMIRSAPSKVIRKEQRWQSARRGKDRDDSQPSSAVRKVESFQKLTTNNKLRIKRYSIKAVKQRRWVLIVNGVWITINAITCNLPVGQTMTWSTPCKTLSIAAIWSGSGANPYSPRHALVIRSVQYASFFVVIETKMINSQK